MASKVLSIEIGTGLTRVAEVEYKSKNPKTYNLFSLKTPSEMVVDGNVMVNSVFVSQLSNALLKKEISTKRVIFVMNSARVASRIIQIPFVKENRITDLLSANASDYFPIDMDQYELVHEVMGTLDDGGEKKLQLSVLAVPKDMLDSYRTLAAACGLTLEGMDYIGNSIKKMMIKEIPEEVKATLKVDENASVLTVIENGLVKIQRTINYGVAEVIDAVIDSQIFGYAIDTDDAVKELSRRTCMFTSFEKKETSYDDDDDVDREKMRALRTEITEGLRTLVGSTSRILDYYQAQNPDKKIEKIHLIGLGSVVSGLSHLMTNELNYKVSANQQYGNAASSKNAANESLHIAEYFTTIGAAMEPISMDMSDKKAEKKAAAEASSGEPVKESLAGAVLICILGIVGAVAIAAAGYIALISAQMENDRLNRQIDELKYAEDIYAAYRSVCADYDWAMNIEDAVYSPNNELVAFIEELEAKMPSQIIVYTMSASRSGVSLNIELESKAAVADVVRQLRTFDSIYVGAVSTVTDTKDDFGISTVSFTVDCVYVRHTSEE